MFHVNKYIIQLFARVDSSIFCAALLVFNQFELAAECIIALLRDESQFVARGSQAAVGVILSEQESVFRARVIILYGSEQPFVTRSSMSVPIYELARSSSSALFF